MSSPAIQQVDSGIVAGHRDGSVVQTRFSSSGIEPSIHINAHTGPVVTLLAGAENALCLIARAGTQYLRLFDTRIPPDRGRRIVNQDCTSIGCIVQLSEYLLCTAGRDGLVRLIDMRAMNVNVLLACQRGAAYSMSKVGESKIAVGWQDGYVSILNMNTTGEIYEFQPGPNAVRSMVAATTKVGLNGI